MDEITKSVYDLIGIKRYVVRGDDEFKIMCNVVVQLFDNISQDDYNYVTYLINNTTDDDVSDDIVKETEYTGVDALKQLYVIMECIISHINLSEIGDTSWYDYFKRNYDAYLLRDALIISREKIMEFRAKQLKFKSI